MCVRISKVYTMVCVHVHGVYNTIIATIDIMRVAVHVGAIWTCMCTLMCTSVVYVCML